MILPKASALAVFLVLGCTATLTAQDADVVDTTENPQMTAAIQAARAQLDLALDSVVDDRRSVHPALNLKVKLTVNQLGVEEEIIWVNGIELTETGFAGLLANTPTYLRGYVLGDQVTFDRGQIVDWSIMSTDGRMFGHFTTRVLLKSLPPAEAAQIRDMLSDTPIPDSWR